VQTLFFRDLSSNTYFYVRLRSRMAASTSAEGNSKSQTRKDTRKSKKGKKKSVSTPLDSAALESDPWEQQTPWNWTSLTDPSSSRIPPFFTKDGKYVGANFILIRCINKF
jgi:hypothetical protein